MPYAKPTSALALILLLQMAGCATQSTVQQPPVQVVETCPKPPPKPAELKTLRPRDSRQQAEGFLNEFFNSLATPTKP